MPPGLPFRGAPSRSPGQADRIYSNPGFDVIADLPATRDESTVAEALGIRVLEPLGETGTTLVERRPRASTARCPTS